VDHFEGVGYGVRRPVMRGLRSADGNGSYHDRLVVASDWDGSYLVRDGLLGLSRDLASAKGESESQMKEFAKFMGKIPSEYLPEVEKAITHAVQVLGDPASTSAQSQAVADELQSLQEKVRFDSAEAAADAWKEAIEERLKAQWTARLIDQGVKPKRAAKQASELLTPKVNELLEKVEFVRGIVESKPFKWAWLKVTAVVAGAAGLLSFAVYSGVHRGNEASDIGSDLIRKADDAQQMKEFWDREREYDAAMNSIRLSAEEFDSMANILAPSAVVSRSEPVLQPKPLLAQPRPVVALPRAIAAQPINITINRPNQQPVSAQSTVETFVAAMPSPQREQAVENITRSAENESKAPPSATDSQHVHARNITVEARDGNGQIFGVYRQRPE
jgi:hypothetical protein